MNPISSLNMPILGLGVFLVSLVGCGAGSPMASVPDYQAMTDGGEFDSPDDPNHESDISLVAADRRRPANRETSNFGWLYFLMPIAAGSLLVAVAISKMRSWNSNPTNYMEEEQIRLPDGNENSADVLDSADSEPSPDPTTRLDLQNLSAETSALVVSEDHNYSEPARVKWEQAIKKLSMANKQNEQLKAKLREKMDTIGGLEKELARLRDKATITSEKNEKLKSKLREKLAIIDELKHSNQSSASRARDIEA